MYILNFFIYPKTNFEMLHQNFESAETPHFESLIEMGYKTKLATMYMIDLIPLVHMPTSQEISRRPPLLSILKFFWSNHFVDQYISALFSFMFFGFLYCMFWLFLQGV